MSALRRFLLILTMTLLWSPSFLFIKLALTDFQPTTIVFLRTALGALIFFSILYFQKVSLPKSLSFWMHSFFMGIFSSGLPFFLFCFAEKSIESALAAILNGTTPLFTALLAHQFLQDDRLSLNKVIGILFGFFGVLILFSPNIVNGLSGTSQGMMAALSGAISYSISHVYAKKYIAGRQARFVAPAAQLLLSSLILLPFALFWGEDFSTFKMPSFVGITGVLGLTLLGTFLAFQIYFYLLEHCGPTALSMVACFFPVGGMFLGYLFLEEDLTLLGLFAAGLILVGMLIVNEIINFNWIRSKPVPQETVL